MKILQLPKVTKKKVNLKKLELLAKIIRESLKEEAKYLEERSKKDENSLTGRFL